MSRSGLSQTERYLRSMLVWVLVGAASFVLSSALAVTSSHVVARSVWTAAAGQSAWVCGFIIAKRREYRFLAKLSAALESESMARPPEREAVLARLNQAAAAHSALWHVVATVLVPIVVGLIVLVATL
jgi:hypothetical protein